MEKVLIIDDNGINLRTAKEALDDYYEVITVNSCKMALRYLEQHTPDIILLDIQMPEIDGFETMAAVPCRRPKIHRLSFLPRKIILMTKSVAWNSVP